MRPLIARRREAKAQEILDAAGRIVDAGGIDGLSVQRLGQELGVAPAGIYRYFPSKDALIAGLELDAVDRLERAVAAATTRADELVRGRYVSRDVGALLPLVAIARAYAELARAEPARFRLISLLLADTRIVVGDHQAAEILAHARPLIQGASERFAAAAAAKVLGAGDPLERALLYWAGLQGTLQLGKLDRLAPGMFAEATRLPAMARAILVGFGAPAEAVDEATQVLKEKKAEKDRP